MNILFHLSVGPCVYHSFSSDHSFPMKYSDTVFQFTKQKRFIFGGKNLIGPKMAFASRAVFVRFSDYLDKGQET